MTQFTAVFEEVDGWVLGYVEELPGAHVQERTLDQARASLKDVVHLLIETNREIAQEQHAGRRVIREPLLIAA